MSKQALEGKRLNAFAMSPEELVIIGLDTNHKNGEHPLWDERINLPIEENMVLNIMAEGVHETILVRKNGEVPEVVNGRQRVKHAREANKRLMAAGKEPVAVKVMLERGSDARMLGVMITTNEMRRGDELETKLAKLERYLATGKTEDDAAIVFGVTVATIKNWLSLIEASPEVREAVKAGELTPTGATKIARLPREQQVDVVDRIKTQAKENGGRATTEQAARTAKAATTGETVLEKPSAKLVKGLIGSNVNFGPSGDYRDGFLAALRWVRGELATDRVKGLRKAVNAIEEG